MVATRWVREERGLLFAGLAGLVGLGVTAQLACGSGTDTDEGTVPGVTATCASDAATAENTAAVVAATNTLIASLTSAQQSAIKYDKTLANAQKWSNLPTTFVARNGVRLGDMSEEARRAALALAQVATSGKGATLLNELREADEWLVTDGKAASSDYGRGLYFVSILGTPSTSSAWMLQIGGHHLAYNFMYGGRCTSATPLFDGAEPMNWTDSSGVAHAPLESQRAAMVALLGSVGSLSDAKLSGTFNDIVNGPTGGGPGGGTSGDTKYPSSLSYPTGTTGRGVAVSTLSAAQKALVKTAIEAWVKNAADPVSNSLLSVYESDEALAETYVGYTGSTDLSTQSSYVRIDGPRVWIEVTVQGGIVYRNKVHFHTLWRDKAADYGGEFVSP